MSLFRSVVAVLAGLGLILIVVELLEFTLANAVTGGEVSGLAGYFTVLNQPGILAARLVINTLASILGGYMTARIARAQEMRHAAVGGAAKTLALLWGFADSEYAAYMPTWMRVTLIVVTGPAMLLGGSIRARAARAEGAAGNVRRQPDQE